MGSQLARAAYAYAGPHLDHGAMRLLAYLALVPRDDDRHPTVYVGRDVMAQALGYPDASTNRARMALRRARRELEAGGFVERVGPAAGPGQRTRLRLWITPPAEVSDLASRRRNGGTQETPNGGTQETPNGGTQETPNGGTQETPLDPIQTQVNPRQPARGRLSGDSNYAPAGPVDKSRAHLGPYVDLDSSGDVAVCRLGHPAPTSGCRPCADAWPFAGAQA